MIVISFLGLLVLIVAMYTILMLGNNIDFTVLFNYNSGILGRLLLSQGAGTFLSFDIFPDIHPYIGFSSVSEFISYVFFFVLLKIRGGDYGTDKSEWCENGTCWGCKFLVYSGSMGKFWNMRCYSGTIVCRFFNTIAVFIFFKVEKNTFFIGSFRFF